jgi:hypothetical protein
MSLSDKSKTFTACRMLPPPQGMPWGERIERGTLRARELPGQFPLDNPAHWRDNRWKPHLSPQAMRHS